MSIHDWSRVDANLFHDFHQSWTVEIRRALNSGLLPDRYSALLEPSGRAFPGEQPASDLPPDRQLAGRANRVTIRHRLGEVVCIIEVVSPGNKSSRAGLRSFVEKTHEFLSAGVNVLVVDLFPPTPRDPSGIHKAIWDEIEEIPFDLDPEQPLTLAAYVAGDLTAGRAITAYVQPVAVGTALPDMPAYLDAVYNVPVPLERTYQAAWNSCPADMRFLVEHGRLPDES